MSLSLRSVRETMREVLPDEKFSQDAVRELKAYVEREIERVTRVAHARHERENQVRAEIDERPRVMLSGKDMRKAIKGDWKVPMVEEGGLASSED